MRRLIAAVSFVAMASGCVMSPIETDQTTARFFLESANDEGVRVVLPQSDTGITIAVKPVFTEFDLVRVEIVRVELGECLLFQLTPAAARDLYRLSHSHAGQRLVLMVNDRAMGARRINQPLNEGAITIFVETPDDMLPALQEKLHATTTAIQRVARKL